MNWLILKGEKVYNCKDPDHNNIQLIFISGDVSKQKVSIPLDNSC